MFFFQLKPYGCSANLPTTLRQLTMDPAAAAAAAAAAVKIEMKRIGLFIYPYPSQRFELIFWK